MSECQECIAASESGGHHRRFDSLKCVYCAARLIQKIKRLGAKTKEEREALTARCKAALAASVAHGLSEKEIRRLEEGPMAVAPKDGEKKGKKK